jgi:uncharacterized protein (TIGR01244 family)
MKRLLLVCALSILSIAAYADHERVADKPTEGIRNLKVIESTVACAGAITPDKIPAVKAMGYVSVINLRRSEEEGARVEEEAEAARAAGLHYVHIPFSSSDPDPAAVDQFLAAFSGSGMEPAFIHCAGGGRAASMWYAKLALVDGMDSGHALEEARRLGLDNETLEAFMTNYIVSKSGDNKGK